MMRSQRFRLIAALALAATLAGLPVQAAGSAAPPISAREGLSRLWVWLAAQLPFRPVTAAHCDESSFIDPDGRCRAGLFAGSGGVDGNVTPDESAHMDPNG
jgi:hypothetical protein